MSRLQPYRNRIPTHIIKLLDVSSRITLFLVGQNGPLSFIFKDRLENKCKTTIGADIKCSCSVNKNDHCIHSLYVLLKIFKISVDNPIIWQAAYIDSELSDIVSGKHTVAPVRQRINRPNFVFQQENQQLLPSDFFARKEIRPMKYAFKSAQVEPMELEQDSVCPICQEEMKKSMCLTYCKVSCGNNYHLECLKVWVSHKKNEEGKITCPMCRQEFHSNIFEELKSEEIEYKKKQVVKNSHKYKCSSCGLDEIVKNVHKCVLCEKFELCEACYLNNKHIKHPFVKCNEVGEWQAADERRQNELKIKEFINNKRSESKNKEILQKMRAVQSSPANLIDYICSSYPYVSKYISENIDPYKKLNLEPERMECQKCGCKRMIFLRRLPCGHFIDHECLKENIRKGVMYCEKDGDKILKGYENLLLKEKEIQYEEEKVVLEVGSQFSPRHMEELLDQQQENVEGQNNDEMYNFEHGNDSRETRNRVQQSRHNQVLVGNYRSDLRRNTNNLVQRQPQRQRPSIPVNPQRRASNQIRISSLMSRKNSKSRSGLPLNLLLGSNPSSEQQITRQPQIKQSQKRGSLHRNTQIQTQQIGNYDQRLRRIQRMEVLNSRLPSLSGQRNKLSNEINPIHRNQFNNILTNSQFGDVFINSQRMIAPMREARG